MANFTCGTCQFTTTASDKHVGRSTKCPQCQAVGTIVPDVHPTSSPSIDSSARQPSKGVFHNVVEKLKTPDSLEAHDVGLPNWAAISIAITFVVLGILATFGSLLLVLAIGAAESAPQEAAVGATFAAMFIAGYVVARSIEKVVRAICRR